MRSEFQSKISFSISGCTDSLKSSGVTEADGVMGESGPGAFLEYFSDVDTGGGANDHDGCFAGLCDVEEVVEGCLSGVVGEEVEFLEE